MNVLFLYGNQLPRLFLSGCLIWWAEKCLALAEWIAPDEEKVP